MIATATTLSTSPLPASQPRRVTHRVASLGGEGAFGVLAEARRLEAAGRRVCHLEIGEPDFPTPGHIVEAGARALRDGETRYVDPAGLRELRDAIAEVARGRGIEGVTADRVVVTSGAKPALFYALLALVAPGDEVLVPDPGWPIYESVVRFAGGRAVPYALDPARGHAPNVADVAARVTTRTRVVVVNSPGNPAGGVLDARELHALAELAERHDLLVVSDEIYRRLSYDGEAASIAAVPGMARRTVVVDGFSKAYAMTGWRLGFAVLPSDELARALPMLVVNTTSCTPAFVQRAGLAALTGPDEPVRAMIAEFHARRDLFVRALDAIPGVHCPTPAGAFYVFPEVGAVLGDAGLSAAELADRLLQEGGVACLPGTAFGAAAGGRLRLSYAAARETLTAAAAAIRAQVESLAGTRARDRRAAAIQE